MSDKYGVITEVRHPPFRVRWNAGYDSNGRPTVSNILFGASWVHNFGWTQRLVHIYIGFWTVSLAFATSTRAEPRP